MASGLVSLDIRSLLPPDTAVIPADFYCGNTTLIRLDLSTLPISVIESDCFRYLHSLTELILSRHLVRIESGSFRELVSIRLIDLSNCSMLLVLEENTFVGAHLLRTLILPDGLVEIGPGAFRELMSLENLTIPASVMTISPRAFNRCSRLRNVILRGQPNIDPNAFKGCHPSLTFVHQSSSELEARRLQPGQAAARGGEMRVAVVQPPVHLNSPFRFNCYIGKYDALKEKLRFGQADEGSECQITYEKFVDDMEIVILPCGHAFSVIGMSEWYSKECEDTCCPSCMKKLH